MNAAEQESGGGPRHPDVVRPGTDAEKPWDVDADARRKKEKPPSPTERYEARVDSYIAQLKEDKQQLEEEVRRLRTQEIYHLREDVRWLENHASWQSQELARTRTAYESAIAFSWISFASIAIGGRMVRYAAFIHPEMQKLLATAGPVGLLIGVVQQGANSWLGRRHILGRADPPGITTRPRPYPQPVNAP